MDNKVKQWQLRDLDKNPITSNEDWRSAMGLIEREDFESAKNCYFSGESNEISDFNIVKKVYQKLSLKCHPDKVKGKEESFKNLNHAYLKAEDELGKGIGKTRPQSQTSRKTDFFTETQRQTFEPIFEKLIAAVAPSRQVKVYFKDDSIAIGDKSMGYSYDRALTRAEANELSQMLQYIIASILKLDEGRALIGNNDGNIFSRIENAKEDHSIRVGDKWWILSYPKISAEQIKLYFPCFLDAQAEVDLLIAEFTAAKKISLGIREEIIKTNKSLSNILDEKISILRDKQFGLCIWINSYEIEGDLKKALESVGLSNTDEYLKDGFYKIPYKDIKEAKLNLSVYERQNSKDLILQAIRQQEQDKVDNLLKTFNNPSTADIKDFIYRAIPRQNQDLAKSLIMRFKNESKTFKDELFYMVVRYGKPDLVEWVYKNFDPNLSIKLEGDHPGTLADFFAYRLKGLNGGWASDNIKDNNLIKIYDFIVTKHTTFKEEVEESLQNYDYFEEEILGARKRKAKMLDQFNIFLGYTGAQNRIEYKDSKQNTGSVVEITPFDKLLKAIISRDQEKIQNLLTSIEGITHDQAKKLLSEAIIKCLDIESVSMLLKKFNYTLQKSKEEIFYLSIKYSNFEVVSLLYKELSPKLDATVKTFYRGTIVEHFATRFLKSKIWIEDLGYADRDFYKIYKFLKQNIGNQFANDVINYFKNYSTKCFNEDGNFISNTTVIVENFKEFEIRQKLLESIESSREISKEEITYERIDLLLKQVISHRYEIEIIDKITNLYITELAKTNYNNDTKKMFRERVLNFAVENSSFDIINYLSEKFGHDFDLYSISFAQRFIENYYKIKDGKSSDPDLSKIYNLYEQRVPRAYDAILQYLKPLDHLIPVDFEKEFFNGNLLQAPTPSPIEHNKPTPEVQPTKTPNSPPTTTAPVVPPAPSTTTLPAVSAAPQSTITPVVPTAPDPNKSWFLSSTFLYIAGATITFLIGMLAYLSFSRSSQSEIKNLDKVDLSVMPKKVNITEPKH